MTATTPTTTATAPGAADADATTEIVPAASVDSAAPASPPATEPEPGAVEGDGAMPTTRSRRRIWLLVAVIVGGLLLLAGAFFGGVAVGNADSGPAGFPGSGQMPGDGQGFDRGDAPQLPGSGTDDGSTDSGAGTDSSVTEG